MFHSRILRVSLLLAGAAALEAAEPRFGVQGALALPQADLGDSANLGLQLGGHGLWDFGRGHGLWARVDLSLYGQKAGHSASGLGAGADYTYHIEGRPRGFYFLAGLSAQGYHVHTGPFSQDGNGLGLDLGGGFDLDRNLGLQLRYTTHSLDGATLGSLNLGVTYTF